MDIFRRTALGFALIIIITGLMFAVQIAAEEWLTLNPPGDMTPILDKGETQNFIKSDFNYFSSRYRPYKEPLPIAVDDKLKNSSWYLMFVNPNVTPPYGGNPYLSRTGYVEIKYEFKNLAGTAAFHALGIYSDNTWKTNRMTGYGSSAYYVAGNAIPGESMDYTTELLEYNNIQVRTINEKVIDRE